MVLSKQHFISFAFFLLLSFIGGNSLLGQQATIFNNYVYNNFLINPANAGGVDLNEHRVALGYRTQWLSFGEDRPTAIIANYDGAPFGIGESNSTHLGIGVNVMSDRAHVINRTSANVSVAGHVLLSNSLKLSAGIRLGGVNNGYNFTGIEVANTFDPIYQEAAGQSDFLMDIGGGLNLKYKTPTVEANIGVSSFQLPSETKITDTSNYFLHTHLLPTARVRFNFSKSEINGQAYYKLGLEPAISYRGLAGRALGGGGLDAGLRIHLMDAAWFGGGFRTNGAGYYGSLGLKPVHNLEISGSYEFHTQLGTSFEVGLNYAFGRKKPPVLEARLEQKEIDKAKAAIAKQEADEAKALAKKEEEERKLAEEARDLALKEAKAEEERNKKEKEAAEKEAARLADLQAKKKAEEAKIAAKKAEEDAKALAQKEEEERKQAAKKAEEEARLAEAKAKEDAKLADAKAKEDARIAEEQRKAEEKAQAIADKEKTQAAKEKAQAEKEAERLAALSKKKQEEEAAKAAKEAEAAAKEKERLAEIERKRKAEEDAAAAKLKEEEAKKDPCAAIDNRNGIWFRPNRMQERANLLELDFDFVNATHSLKETNRALNYEYSVYQEEYNLSGEVKRLVNEVVDITHDALNPCRLPKMEPELQEISLSLKLAETKEELDFDSGYSYEGEFGNPATSNYSIDDSFNTINVANGELSFEKIFILKLIALRNALTEAFSAKGIEVPNSSVRLILLTEQDVDQEVIKIEILLKPEE